MTLDKIWEYVNSNKDELKKLGINFNKQEINEGDEYRHEDGVSFFFKIFAPGRSSSFLSNEPASII